MAYHTTAASQAASQPADLVATITLRQPAQSDADVHHAHACQK
jgi:hypothetical protein